MIKEEVIIHRDHIQKSGEQKYFQIDLPKDTFQIIGIETGVFRYTSGTVAPYGGIPINDPGGDPIDPAFKVSYNDPIGKLTLQTTEGLIYQGEVRQEDKNSKWADFSQVLNDGFFDQYSHGKKRYEDSINIKTCIPMIEGDYKDSWALHYNYHIEYELLVYIWIEKSLSK
jgi:hypothetical protein